MRYSRRTFGMILALGLLTGFALWAADPPMYLNYQGVLRNASNAPLSGTYEMTFRFYDSLDGGTLLLTDQHLGPAPVTVSNGLFNVILGNYNVVPGTEPNMEAVFKNHMIVYLEAQVGGETLAPRVLVVSAAYAQNAHALDGKEASDFALTGSGGTANQVPKYLDANMLGNSAITEVDGKVGVGKTGPYTPLNVQKWANSTDWRTARQLFIQGDDWGGTTGDGLGAVPNKYGLEIGYQYQYGNPSHGGRIQAYATGLSNLALQPEGGNVGIGTTTPTSKLDVAGDAHITGALKDSSGSAGTTGQVLQSTGTGTQWATGGGGGDAVVGNEVTDASDASLTRTGSGTAADQYKLRLNSTNPNWWSGVQTFQSDTGFPAGIWTATGRVGIGKTSPSCALDVVGGVNINGELDGSIFDPNTDSTDRTAAWFDNTVSNTHGAKHRGVLSKTGGGSNNTAGEFDANGSYLVSASASASQTGILATAYGAATTNKSVDAYGGDFGTYVKSDDTSGLAFGYGARAHARIDGIPDGGLVRVYGVEAEGEGCYNHGEAYGLYAWGRNGATNYGLYASATGGTTNWAGYFGGGNVYVTHNLGIGISPSYSLHLDTDSAAKPSTNTWTIASDGRLKKDIAPFTDGLGVIEKINPVRYRYNGLAGTPNDVEGIGVVAQEIKEAAPYTVGTFKAKLDERAESDTELYNFNSHALTFVLINAVKELDERTKSLASSSGSSGTSAGQSGGSRPGGEASGAEARNTEASQPTVSESAGTAATPVYPVCEPAEEGDVLTVDEARPGLFCLARQAADPGVVGIVSGVSRTGQDAGAAEEGLNAAAYVPMATTGVALCKVDASFGPIAVRDLLVASPNPGHAMKGSSSAPGTVVGKALEPLASGAGLIQILVMLR